MKDNTQQHLIFPDICLAIHYHSLRFFKQQNINVMQRAKYVLEVYIKAPSF